MTRRTRIILGAAVLGTGVAVREIWLSSRRADLRRKVVLITGGSKGLGLALAREFAEHGSYLALCARDEDELSKAKQELEANGTPVFISACDVSDQRAVSRMIHEVIDHYGRIDVLVNNAGQIEVGPLASMTVEDFEHAMQVMFWGVIYPTLEVLPSFTRRGSGRIVNITSVGGKVSVPHLVPYNCAKFAATGFSEGLRAELAGDGISVTTIAPGLMRTGSSLNAEYKGDRKAEAAWFNMSANSPLVSMSAEEAAREIVAATKRGDAERILGAPANLLARAHGMFPGLVQDLLGAAALSFLPSGKGRSRKLGGFQIPLLNKPWMRAALFLGRAAAKRYNQRTA